MPDPLPLVGRVLGEFEVLERVASGGFGDLYRARQSKLGRDAVIKVLRREVAGVARERFNREAQLASQLDHPYAAHIYAFGIEADDTQWIAMELVRGSSLSELLVAQGPLPLARFVPLFQAICQVVQVAHEQGIVHRDIKPANVMVVARAGVLLPKLLDFGIARVAAVVEAPVGGPLDQRVDRLLDTGEDKVGWDTELDQLLGQRLAQVTSTPRDRADLTSGQMYLGSPPYMAPELWLRPHAAGPACDIYALGILAFECLTARQPYTGDKLTDLARAHLQPLPSLPGELPTALHDALLVATAKRAKQRFPDALGLSRAVEAACRTQAFVALPRAPGDVVAGVLAKAPQPIAETLAAADASTRPQDAAARYVAVIDIVAQYVGVLALASWMRLGQPDTGDAVRACVRRLARGGLSGREWLELAAVITKPFARMRDAFPLPELVDLCHPRDGATPTSDAIRARLADFAPPVDASKLDALVAAAGETLAAIGELFEYDLAALGERGYERWSGTRRKPRIVLQTGIAEARGVAAEPGAAFVLDRHGAPLLALAPLARAIAPTAAAEPEMFLVAGPGRYGARLVAAPYGFERQDPELARWLEDLAGDAAAGAADDKAERAPYRGLASFSVDDNEFFFGRERESENLANHLRAHAFAAVVGPSGAGKSSYVQAGVVPLLPADWRAVVMRPGSAPLAALFEKLSALGLAPLPEAERGEPLAIRAWLEREARARQQTILLYIDQAEELVTLCRDETERAAFARLLASVRDDERVRVVMTMRDDFLMRLQHLPGLHERLPTGIHLLGTPSRADLRRILVEPARRMRYEFEDGELVEEMVDRVADNPSALALLSFTAARLWELRDRQFRKLRRSVYKSIGGVGGALAQHAEDVIQNMPAGERELVREAFRHLVTADGTRAVIAKSELLELLGGGEQGAHVIERLVDARLCVTTEATGGVTVEITHEALLESWPRLVTWRREDAENARMRDQLRTSAKQWQARERQRGLLWRGDVLVEYKLWRARYRGHLSEIEEAFGAACLREQRRALLARRLVTAGAFGVLAATAVVLYVFAMRARDSAATATTNQIEVLEEQGRADLLALHPLRAARPLARAYELGGRQASLRFLLAAAMTSVESRGSVITGHTGDVRRAWFSVDGTRVVSDSDDHTVRLWDAVSGAQLASIDVHIQPRIARTRDGTSIAAAGSEEAFVANTHDLAIATRWKFSPPIKPINMVVADGGKRVIVGDASGVVHVLDADGHATATPSHKGLVLATAITPDGQTWASGGNEGHIALVHDGAAPLQLEQGSGVIVLGFSPDGRRLASGGRDGAVKLWAGDTGAPLRVLAGHSQAVRMMAFSPDGTRLATASEDGTIRLWPLDREATPLVLAGHQGAVFSVQFDRDAHHLVSAGADGVVRLWDAASGAALDALDAHSAEAFFADFDTSGARVVSAGIDRIVRIWNIPQRATSLALPATTGFLAAAADAHGERFATAGADGVVRVFARTGTQLAAFDAKRGELRAAGMSPDGRLVVFGAANGDAWAWHPDTPGEPQPIEAAKGGTFVACFSRDGRQLVTAGGDGIVRVLDPQTGATLRKLIGHRDAISGAVFSADGTLLATASDDRTVRIWDMASGRERQSIALSSEANAVAFDPAAQRVAVVSADGMLHVYALPSGALLGELRAHHAIATAVDWSDDGERIATSSSDMTATLWDARTLRELARIRRHVGPVMALGFLGDRLWSAGKDGAIWLTDLPIESRSPDTIDRILNSR